MLLYPMNFYEGGISRSQLEERPIEIMQKRWRRGVWRKCKTIAKDPVFMQLESQKETERKWYRKKYVGKKKAKGF